jgi:predicted MPP superfamily phosphohydrolase
MFFISSFLIALTCLVVIHRWAVTSFGWLGRRRRRVTAVAGAILAAWVATDLIERVWQGPLIEAVHTAVTVLVMTLEIAALPILAFRLVAWVASTAWTAWHAGQALPAGERGPGESPVSAPPAAPTGAVAGMSRRQMVEGVAGISAIGASGAILGWGSMYGRHEFETREVPVRIAGLPRALDGYVIAQISDLHVGEQLDERDIDTGLELVRRTRPDLVVVTGDIVDRDAAHAPYIARRLADLPARDGVTAILGNHDHYAGAGAVVAALRAAGVAPLVDDGRIVRPNDGGGFALLGVDDRWARRHGGKGPDLDRAIASVRTDAPRILLSHQPVTVDDWPGRVALQLSGHTHGGQVNPGFRPADLFFRYVAGLYSVGGTTLYVNRGFGTVGPPARVGAPPEVTRIVLVAA